VVRFRQVGNRFFQSGYIFINVVEMLSADLYFNGLVTTQFIIDNRFYNIVGFVFYFFLKQGFTVFRVKGLTGKNVINNGSC